MWRSQEPALESAFAFACILNVDTCNHVDIIAVSAESSTSRALIVGVGVKVEVQMQVYVHHIVDRRVGLGRRMRGTRRAAYVWNLLSTAFSDNRFTSAQIS